MWPDERLVDLLGVRHPIVQAPMAGSSTPELAAAVANAGGLGSLGSATMPPDAIREAVQTVQRRTNGPFNLNFFAHSAPPPTPAEELDIARKRLEPWYEELNAGPVPDAVPNVGPGFDEPKLKLLLELRPAVVSFHFGTPDAQAISRLKDAGIVLLGTATNVAEARALQAAGMDAVVAQGWEAGGHRGSHTPNGPADGVGTMALVPQIVDAVTVPVIAAGGIGDGRGIAAAFALGASGVQIGTGFLSCTEAATDEPRRALLRNARDDDTIVTDAVSGRSARAARSRFSETMTGRPGDWPGFLAMPALSGPLLRACEAAGRDDVSFHLYGQAAALNREMEAGALVERLADEARESFGRLAGRV